MSRYDYAELRAAAMDTRSQEDLDNLASWLIQHGMIYWNGEAFDIDDGYMLRPVYETFDDAVSICRWEIV